MRIEPEIDGASVVLLGVFNPAILTPAWFVRRGLLPNHMEAEAELRVAHPEIVEFDADWLELKARKDRFLAGTTRSPHVRIRDLVKRVFGEHLAHTPITALGINRMVHFRVESPQVRDRVGRTLAPTAAWGAWKDDLESDVGKGGMTSLTMTQVNPHGRPRGSEIGVTVEPSKRVGEGKDGIYVAVNDHYAIPSEEAEPGRYVDKLLSEHFGTSLQNSEGRINHVMSLASDRSGQ